MNGARDVLHSKNFRLFSRSNSDRWNIGSFGWKFEALGYGVFEMLKSGNLKNLEIGVSEISSVRFTL